MLLHLIRCAMGLREAIFSSSSAASHARFATEINSSQLAAQKSQKKKIDSLGHVA
jgi:hypothetical protein